VERDVSSRRGAVRLGVLLAVLACSLALGFVAPSSGRAAQPPTFEPGRLTSEFPKPVSWSFGFNSDVAPQRVELLTQLQGSSVVFVTIPGPTEITQRGTGSWVVSGTDLGAVTPNTLYKARLRITTGDGVFLGPEASVLVSDERFDWNVRESERLRLHWYAGGADFATRALRVGEDGVSKAQDFMGVHLASKVDVFVYADEAPFRDAIGQGSPENAAGVPFSGIATLFALIRPEQIDSSWVGEVVPHELTHLVLGAGIGPGVDVPLWLNEGLAVYLSTGDTNADRQMVRDAIKSGTLVPLDGLAGNFPTNAQGDRSIAAYAEAVSAVAFMDRTYGQPGIAMLIGGFATVGAEDAFMHALGVDQATFGSQWLQSLGARTPKVYGPQPAPPGPLPSDWLGPPPVAGQVPTASPTAAPSAAEPGTNGGGGEGPGPSAVAVGILLVTVLLASAALAAAILQRRRRTP
jgi:hypothetical protein